MCVKPNAEDRFVDSYKRKLFRTMFSSNEEFTTLLRRWDDENEIELEDVEDIPGILGMLDDEARSIVDKGIVKNIKGKGPILVYPMFDESDSLPDASALPSIIEPLVLYLSFDPNSHIERWAEALYEKIKDRYDIDRSTFLKGFAIPKANRRKKQETKKEEE